MNSACCPLNLFCYSECASVELDPLGFGVVGIFKCGVLESPNIKIEMAIKKLDETNWSHDIQVRGELVPKDNESIRRRNAAKQEEVS
jgi:hypothetical protein